MNERPEEPFPSLIGLRIAVIEDEVLISMMLEDILNDFGCEVVGPALSIEQAIETVAAGHLDGALLDMNMRGRSTRDIANELTEQAIPFLLVTGYGPQSTDTCVMQNAPRLIKPFTPYQLGQRMVEVFPLKA